MKNSTWAWLLGILAAVCIALGLWLMRPTGTAQAAEVWSQGKLLYTLPLARDRTVTVLSEDGENVITVRDGKIAVTEADCRDGFCMRRGFCSGGAEIVCLPHRLVIRFVGGQLPDGVSG